MHREKKPTLADLNQHLTCKLCKGYFIDATTIIECLHSFCRSCIVKHLESSKYCPVCDVQVHKTKPLLNIRPDKTLQDVVYKLVPRLFQNEVNRRRVFCASHSESKPHDPLGHNYAHIITSDESISLTLQYHGCRESTRYLRCPAAVTVTHLQKLIRAKYGLLDNHHVDILYNQDCLNATLTLVDIAYIYSWRRTAPLDLTYRIYERAKPSKCNPTDDTSPPSSLHHNNNNNNNNNNWKEVQLRISENGEMSIIQDEALELVNNNNYKAASKKELPELKYIGKCATLPDQTPVTSCVSLCSTSSTATKTVYSTINSSKCSVSSDSDKEVKPLECPVDKGVKRKLAEAATSVGEQSPKLQKPTPAPGLQTLSNNHPLKRHATAPPPTTESDDPVFTKPLVVHRNVPVTRPGTPKPKPCYMPKHPVINVPKPATSSKPPTTVPHQPIKTTNKSASPALGYKTLRDPPKSWNSQIAKANLTKSPPDLKNARPAKFFKMRNNMPRYLGNPASGVKPMYQVHVSPEKDKEKAAPAGEIKKHSIVKIDPKTLKPISEKAPETTSLSTAADLKINTSSVSIFNPLKLQNSSPKGERKSPKSPHCGSPPSKRDKLSLNFTPSNPFIPNLASPTVSPNQFLYPAAPTGFPPYDPRVMAAYHNLFYGQRMAFPPAGLAMDLNHQRKGFELGPKTTGSKQAAKEKSLQNAVEKLTQNRTKEISKNEATSKASEAKRQETEKRKEAKEAEGETTKKKVEKVGENQSKADAVKTNGETTPLDVKKSEEDVNEKK